MVEGTGGQFDLARLGQFPVERDDLRDGILLEGQDLSLVVLAKSPTFDAKGG